MKEVRLAALLIAAALAGCAMTPVASMPAASPAPTGSATSARPSPSDGPSPAESPPPIHTVLPERLGDVELHTFEVGGDILARLAETLGVEREQFETAFASEHGGRFIQMTAIRLPGVAAEMLQEAWETSAYPPDTTDVTVVPATIRGRDVTVVDAASVKARLGTFYTLTRGDALVVVQTFDPRAAEEALAALP